MPRVGGRRRADTAPEWLSITDYAFRYGVDRSTVYKWLESNLLETYRVGTLVRIKNLPPASGGSSPPVVGC